MIPLTHSWQSCNSCLAWTTGSTWVTILSGGFLVTVLVKRLIGVIRSICTTSDKSCPMGQSCIYHWQFKLVGTCYPWVPSWIVPLVSPYYSIRQYSSENSQCTVNSDLRRDNFRSVLASVLKRVMCPGGPRPWQFASHNWGWGVCLKTRTKITIAVPSHLFLWNDSDF